ncbi:MAG: tRNA (adenosine(37)-N6)-threonylcarbamoyltransferase complex dimerization subunit type 1 TsaB [Kosmotogaceae bacterium]
MKFLTIDSSTKKLLISAVNENSKVGMILDNAGKHGKLLAPAIKDILEYVELDVKDLDFLGCGIGPGSLTGLRVGISTIKGLSLPWKKQIAIFSSLDIVSRAAGVNGNHVVLRKGRKGFFYWQKYDRANRVGVTEFSSIEDLHSSLEKGLTLVFENEKDASAFGEYRTIISPEPSLEILTTITANNYYAKKLVNAMDLKPLYRQKSIAEINWEKKHGDNKDSL